MEMITHGAEKIVNDPGEFKVDDDIEEIITRGEERTAELNSRYEGLTFEDLSNFKSESTVQQWEGEDFRAGVCSFLLLSIIQAYSSIPLLQRKTLQFNPLALSKRERKLNYSVDSYFKETMRAGPSKTEKAPKIPRAPKQIQMYVPRSDDLGLESYADDRTTGKTSSSSRRDWRSCRSKSSLRTSV